MREPVPASCLNELFTELIGVIPFETHHKGRVDGDFVIWYHFSSSLPNTNVHLLLDQPENLTGLKAMVKHLSDVVLCNLPTLLSIVT